MLGVALLALACAPAPDVPLSAQPGGPLPGLRTDEMGRFVAGRALFDKIFTPREGLGPLFNENQCSACHTDPASGGTGEQRVVKATRFVPPTTCDYLTGLRGQNVRQHSTAALQALGITHESLPPDANGVGRFMPPFLFGLGLVEAIPASEILSRADPDDRDGDGISGRPGRTATGALGRFGRKAESATTRDFVSTALRQEMGLTNSLGPTEMGLNGGPLPPGTDPAPEPEVDSTVLGRLADYVRFLGPLPRPSLTADARDSASHGEMIFRRIGCASCHVPSMTTGSDPVAALDHKTFYLYSDLLLHDMGPGLADVCGIGASPAELRTALLAGLSYRKQYLHDGRALSVRDAILWHGGEAARARDAFRALPLLDQQMLLRFLDTL